MTRGLPGAEKDVPSRARRRRIPPRAIKRPWQRPSSEAGRVEDGLERENCQGIYSLALGQSSVYVSAGITEDEL